MSDDEPRFLVTTATETTGLSGGAHARKRAEEITDILTRWWRVIADRLPKA